MMTEVDDVLFIEVEYGNGKIKTHRFDVRIGENIEVYDWERYKDFDEWYYQYKERNHPSTQGAWVKNKHGEYRNLKKIQKWFENVNGPYPRMESFWFEAKWAKKYFELRDDDLVKFVNREVINCEQEQQ